MAKKKIIEKNHFIIQSVRIPTTEEPSLKKLIQIALNIGQYYGIKDNKNINLPYNSINSFVSKNVSNIELNKYVSKNVGREDLTRYLENNYINKLLKLTK